MNFWAVLSNALFSAIGFVAFVYGKKISSVRPMVVGILLMGAPFLIYNQLILLIVSLGLLGLLYFSRD